MNNWDPQEHPRWPRETLGGVGGEFRDAQDGWVRALSGQMGWSDAARRYEVGNGPYHVQINDPGHGYSVLDRDGRGVVAHYPSMSQAIDEAERLNGVVSTPGMFGPRVLPDLPEDGKDFTIAELQRHENDWTIGRGGSDDDPIWDGFEFWDRDLGTWRNGGDAFLDGDALIVDDPYENGTGFEARDGITMRRMVDPTGAARPEHGDRPDPTLEYLHTETGMWLPGSVIDTDRDEEGQVHWLAYDSEFETDQNGTIPSRPAIYPTDWSEKPPDPENPGARLIRALDLLDPANRSYLLGGYEVLGPDDGWHTIEEVYQDDPDEEQMELIADGLHWPALDTSEELTIRRKAD